MFFSSEKIDWRFVTYFLILFIVLESNAIVIKIKQGKLKGLVLQSRNGTSYHAFLGIPYAKPPVGDLRFEPPQPPDPWTDIRDASKPSPKCILKIPSIIRGASGKVEGKEDCLYLNIYTPSNIKELSRIPVLVSVPGAFSGGDGYSLDPMYFLDHKIIFVSFNCRSGPLGFLSAYDEILPGNYGLKDQVAALKWVQQNIADFGGDPQRVSIFGMSNAGVCVHFHMHSRLSKGLFQGAISQSGTALASWAQDPPSVARQKLHAFAILAGCSIQSTQILVDCLKKVPAEEMVEIQQKFYVWDFEPMFPFVAVIEPSTVKDAFLIENPWNQKVLQDVPWIVGITAAEGVFKITRFLSNNGKLADELNANYERLLPMIFSYKDWLNASDVDKVTKNLMQYYFGAKKMGKETAHELVNMFGDALFNYDCIEAAYRHTNKLFFYNFDHKMKKSIANIFGNYSEDLGVSHGEDFFSFFPGAFLIPDHELSVSDLRVSERMVKYWINFAYTGEPTLDNTWRPSESEELDYLHIKTDKDVMERGLLRDRYLFWKNLQAHPSHIITDGVMLRDEL